MTTEDQHFLPNEILLAKAAVETLRKHINALHQAHQFLILNGSDKALIENIREILEEQTIIYNQMVEKLTRTLKEYINVQ